MKVFVVISDNIEGMQQIHSVCASYDTALEEVHTLMKSQQISVLSVGPECWKPLHRTGWWYYGCDSIGISEFELKGKVNGG